MDFDTSVSTESKSAEKAKAESQTEGVDYIEFNGERYEDFIECDDGEKVPEIPESFKHGEMYALSTLVNYVMGPEIGDSDQSSAYRELDHDSFPNKAIGQFEGMESKEEIELGEANSPGHYFYRKIGAGKVKGKMKEKFHEECEERGIPQNLEVYKRNFPVRTDWKSGEEFVTVEEIDGKPWENHQIPKGWADEYDGFPPVNDEPEESPEESEPESNEEPEETPEFDGNLTIPDDEWEECNTDADRMRAIFGNNPSFNAIEKSRKVEILTEAPFEFGKSNVYSTLKGWNSEESDEETKAQTAETDTARAEDDDMVMISEDRLDELQNAEEELETMKELLN